jgi:hypothetical protein
MRALAGLLGLEPADNAARLVDIPTATASLQISRGGEICGLSCTSATASSPNGTTDWARAAEGQGFVILTVGQDPWDGQMATLDRSYLRRANRLHIGRLTITTGQG